MKSSSNQAISMTALLHELWLLQITSRRLLEVDIWGYYKGEISFIVILKIYKVIQEWEPIKIFMLVYEIFDAKVATNPFR